MKSEKEQRIVETKNFRERYGKAAREVLCDHIRSSSKVYSWECWQNETDGREEPLAEGLIWWKGSLAETISGRMGHVVE